MKQLTRKILALLLCAVLLLGMTACTQTPNEPTEKKTSRPRRYRRIRTVKTRRLLLRMKASPQRGMIRSLSRSRLLKHSVCLQS